MWKIIDSMNVLIFIDSIEPVLSMPKTKFADPVVDWSSWIISSIFCRTFSCPMSPIDRVAAFEFINRFLNFVSSYLDDVEEMYAYEMLEFSVLTEFFDSSILVIWCFAAWSVRKSVVRMQSNHSTCLMKCKTPHYLSHELIERWMLRKFLKRNRKSICNFSKYWIIPSSSSPSRSVMYWINFRV